MFGLPGQTPDQAIHDLIAAIELHPSHLSWYQLTLEPNTLFAAHPPALPDDDQKWEMQQQGQSLCARSGYFQYEVSAFAQSGKTCQHNQNYWQFGDYIGIGAGAHGKITDAGKGEIRRTWKVRHPAAYLATAHSAGAIDGERVLNESEAVFEFALNRLRLTKPFTLNEFEACCGLERGWITPLIRHARTDGLLNFEGERVQHTAKGWLFLNDLLERFLPEVNQDARDRAY